MPRCWPLLLIFDRDKAERARSKFIEIQALIEALDRAISGEEVIPPKS